MSTISFRKYEDFICLDKSYDDNKCFILIHKPYEEKRNGINITNIEDLKDEFTDYVSFDENEYKGNVIKIFGKNFVKNNKNKCKIIYNNKKYELKEYFNDIDENYNQEIKDIKLKLYGVNNITNMQEMFYRCYHLSSFSEAHTSELYEFNYKNISSLFSEDNKGTNLSKEENYTDLYNNFETNQGSQDSNDIYDGSCLSSFEKSFSKNDFVGGSNSGKTFISEKISKPPLSPNMKLIRNMGLMFYGCISLKSLPDISELNTSEVTDMEKMFFGCINLESLPDISK